MKLLLLMVKNVRRNMVRTMLTSLGTMILVFVVTLILSVVSFLNKATSEKAANLKAIVTERWQIPSQMPFAYANSLTRGAARHPDDAVPTDSMTWQFYGGSLDPTTRTFENIVFFFALEPVKLSTMMDELDELPAERKTDLEAAIKKMESNKQACIIGTTRLQKLNKKIGERIKVYSLNYKGIDLEFEIVGTFPAGTRYDQSAAMHRDYLNDEMDNYARKNNGKKHFMAGKALNLVWLRMPDRPTFEKIAGQIMSSPEFSSPAVKCETAASGIASFLDAYRDLIWGIKFLLTPAILASLSLIIANAISISVRERQMEIAVMKVLGFKPFTVMLLVLGEALLIGVLSGFASSAGTYLVINELMGGLKFPIAFFSTFLIARDALWWGIAIGAGTAFVGSIVPAWSARSVRVADVFSKVA